MHVALLGDSILDNGAYTSGGPDVVAQLREVLPSPAQATLLAVDGDVCDGVHQQLDKMPRDVTHLLLSVGGNDALQAAGVLMQPVSSVAEALLLLSEISRAFEARYARLLDALLRRELPLAVCTIYNPRFQDELQKRVTVAALCHFNDAIVRMAAARGLPVLDLRAVCTAHADFANDIEPSSQGGAKIAAASAELLASHPFSARQTTLYPRP